MRAAVLTAIQGPIEVWDLTPWPLQKGQVEVEVTYSGLCGAQIQEWGGLKGNAKYIPHTFGHEGVGVVKRIGGGVTTVDVGDHVVMHWRKGAGATGINAAFHTKRGHVLNGGPVNTLMEVAYVSEDRVSKIPSNLNPIVAASLGCSMSTGYGIILNDAKVTLGERVCLIGYGGLGAHVLTAAQYASGIAEVSVDEVMEWKHEFFTGGGAKVAEPSDMYDVIIDTTGSMDAVSNRLSQLADGGRVILASQPRGPLVFTNPGSLFTDRGKTIHFTQGGSFNPSRDLAKFIRFAEEIAAEVEFDYEIRPLTDIHKAMEDLRDGNTSRIFIDPTK